MVCWCWPSSCFVSSQSWMVKAWTGILVALMWSLVAESVIQLLPMEFSIVNTSIAARRWLIARNHFWSHRFSSAKKSQSTFGLLLPNLNACVDSLSTMFNAMSVMNMDHGSPNSSIVIITARTLLARQSHWDPWHTMRASNASKFQERHQAIIVNAVIISID